MNISTVMLACGNMGLGPEFTIALTSLAAVWLVTIGLAIANVVMISLNSAKNRPRTDIIVFLIYGVSATALFCGAFNQSEFIILPIVGCPVLCVSHFVHLLGVRRLQKRESQSVDELAGGK